jgi:integrase
MKLKHLNPSGSFSSGNIRYYYRPKGKKGIAMPDLPIDHPKFLAAYAGAADESSPSQRPVLDGSFAQAVTGYLRSDAFQIMLKESTRSVRRRMLDNMRDRYGHARIMHLQSKHVGLDLERFSGHAHNNRLKVWRGFGKWLAQKYKIKDPAAPIKQLPVPKSDGHIPWTTEEIQMFRAHWSIGTSERLALELIFWTGARISDAVRLGQGNVNKDGWLAFVQEKTGGEVEIPFDRDLPDFAERMENDLMMLKSALDARSSLHITWMTTVHGRSRSSKAAGQWFAAKARVAGIQGKTAHGLRKSRAQALAEAGGTTAQISAWTGHESLSEVERYIKKFNKRKVLSSTKTEQKVPTSATKVPTQPKKTGESNA